MSNYEEEPYLGLPIPAAHPRQLAWTSMVFGGPRADLTRARVLEIGCGYGATLLPIAAFEPEWTVLGIDSSPGAIASAAGLVESAKLTNVRLICGDLASLEIEAEAWDVVIAHGIYSWIDTRRRASLRRLIRRALAPNGLAYVSFNALPGWSVRGVVRDLIRRNPDPRAEARDVLKQLTPHATDDPWGQLLAKELRRAEEAEDFYFTHEYCAAHNEAFWLGDFVRTFERDGLRWIGDSQFDSSDGRPYEQMRITLGVPGMRGEELADTIGYRQFRCAVLARDDAERHTPLDDDAIVREGLVWGSASVRDEAADLATAREQTFFAEDNLEIKVAEPLCKAALIVLERIRPDALAFADLLHAARDLLHAEGCAEISPRADRELSEGVARLWRVGALKIRNHRPRLGFNRPRRPKIREFTKHEAIDRQFVTTVLGDAFPADAYDITLLHLMDGTRTEDDLCDDFAKQISGVDLNDPESVKTVRGVVQLGVGNFARWGFLEPPNDGDEPG